MNVQRDHDAVLAWLDDGPATLPADTREAIAVGIGAVRRRRPGINWPFGLGRLRSPTIDLRQLSVALGSTAVVVLAAALALNIVVNQQGGFAGPQPSPTSTLPGAVASNAAESPSHQRTADVETLEPVASRSCGNPDAAAGTTLLGCSTDGTRLLVQRNDENLFILHADGSQTQVTEQLSGFSNIPGSARPTGATISPDGLRVVFAGLTRPWEDGRTCHNGALFAVDASGGPAELLWESQRNRARGPRGGIVGYPTFSPDGTQIAFADGYCDHDHRVWVMNADGSDAHQILSNETTLGAGHVYGLAWSPAGDRLALSFEGGTYTFATDGSGFRRVADASDFCWPGWRC